MTKIGNRVQFCSKEEYYDGYLMCLRDEYEKEKVYPRFYPTREDFDIETREDFRKEFPNKVIEGEEKIHGKFVQVWYTYENENGDIINE